jgi:hypothetical protein
VPRTGQRRSRQPSPVLVRHGLAVAALILSCAVGACRPENPAATAKKEEANETIARTEFTGRIENFFEYEPLRPGKPSRFLIHLTDLNDGAPVAQADVVLTIRRAGLGQPVGETTAKVGRVTGIYVAEVVTPAPGDYNIEFRVRNARLDERMPLTGFRSE